MHKNEIKKFDLLESLKANLKYNYKKYKLNMILFTILIIIVIIGLWTNMRPIDERKQKETSLETSLTNIINVSELSTFETPYNGVAVVKNEKKPDKIDYYVKYETVLSASIDFKKVDVSVDESKSEIIITLPEINIKSPEFTGGEDLTFMFVNKKSDTSGVIAEAYKKCEEDALNEIKSNNAIKKMAKQNAENIMSTMINPFVEYFEKDYKLSFVWEE